MKVSDNSRSLLLIGDAHPERVESRDEGISSQPLFSKTVIVVKAILVIPHQSIDCLPALLSAALNERFPGAVFANYDVGHGHVLGEDLGAAIRSLGPRLRNVHLEDIKGRVHRHLLYGEGDVDFSAVFAALRDIGYRGDYTPDLYPFKDDWKRAMEASAAFLREHGVLAGAL